ncbi:uncharacterized protein LOC109714429 [Ananas comosus]|uniref:Uncharacterized protein LOC109714429 n=1 Tax=Ananas comosus TaxID=4615 RepID=A0A6P5FGE2_ANACO|nr:uncharacterized protein LOC109714429 [Ananas comosus]
MEQHLHVRSISLPSRSHPAVARVEEALMKMRNFEASSSSATVDAICHGLRNLGDLHNCVEDLLQLPRLRQGLLQPNQKKWLGEELELGSVMSLDLCGAMKDMLATMKDHVQELQSALRRGDKTIHSMLNSYISTRREQMKHIKKRYKAARVMNQLLSEESDAFFVIEALLESREITSCLLGSILSLVSKPRPRQKAARWSLVSRVLLRRKVACEDVRENKVANENENFTLGTSYEIILQNDVNGEKVSKVQNQLKTLESSVESLEDGLGCLFRQLVQTRVSLLNILSL